MLKTKSFGSCEVEKFSPTNITEKTKVLNCHVTYGEALKLEHSLRKALDKISNYKMSSKEGKNATVNIAVHLSGGQRI